MFAWFTQSLTLVAFAASCGLAAIPGADDREGATQRKFIIAKRDYNLRTLTGAYRQVGVRDPKWDASAEEFLDAWSTYLANSGEVRTNTLKQHSEAELLEKVGRAIDAGCTDPIIQFGHARFLMDSNKRPEGLELLAKVVEPALQSKYPAERKLWIVRNAISSVDKDLLPAGISDTADELALEVLTSPIADPIERRILRSRFFSGDMGDQPLNRRQELCERAAKLNCDPWLLHMISGEYHIDRAWEGRGGSVARNVKPEGWEVFRRELASARKHLEAAHELHPEFPDAAALMIKVAMANEHGPGQSERFWFEAATLAQFDYLPAYTALRTANRPRWSGSLSQMLEFGFECAATKRFDTMVPLVLLDVVDDLLDERDGDLNVYSPAVVARLSETAAGYAEHPTAAPWKNWYLSYGAAVLWRGRRYDDARDVLDQIGLEVNADASSRVKVTPARLIGSTRTLTGPAGEEAIEAERLASSEDFAAAYAMYQNALKKLPDDNLAADFVRGRLLEFQWTQQFNKGEWVDLLPTDQPASWAPFQNIGGAWEIDPSRSVVCTAQPMQWARLLTSMSFGTRYEINVKLEFADPKSLDRNSMAGVFVGWASPTSFYGIYAYPAADAVLTYGNNKRLKNMSHPVGRECELNVRVWDEQLALVVDGKQLIKKVKMAEERVRPGTTFGITASSQSAPMKVIIREYKIRRLNSPIG